MEKAPRDWTVVASFETFSADRCVDVFVRADGTFGFEEWRRDPEDPRGWFMTGHNARRVYADRLAAIAAARETVSWLGAVLERQKRGDDPLP